MNIKSITSAFLLSALFVVSANAQDKKFSLSLGLEGGLPISAGLKTLYSGAAGGSLRAQYNINEKISATLSAGGIGFIPKDIKGIAAGTSTSTKASAMLSIPVKVGGKYFFAKKVYGMVELGMASNTVFSASASSGAGVSNYKYSAVVYAPGVGAQLGGFDIGLRYETFSKGGSSSFLGLRLAFNLFSIKK